MNSAILFGFFILIAAAFASSSPAAQKFGNQHFLMVQEPEDIASEDGSPVDENFDLNKAVGVVDERADRHRRVTCDLMSVSVPWGSLNHAACAAHCLGMRKGYRGGRCRDGVCHCRK